MRAAIFVLAMASGVAASACDEGSPASPQYQGGDAGGPSSSGGGDAGDDAGMDSGADADVEAGPVYAVCPDMDASFGSIYTQMLSTGSCGTHVKNNCHSTSGASGVTGTGNLLDLSLDASAVYAELLGPDGGGQPSTNIQGDRDAGILRVVPFDAGASMLYVKLTLKTNADPTYGSGMPRPTPGSVCPQVLDAVKAWIDQGAPQN
jgi:hypothetical protein